jgi:hypothetical protein
LSFQYSNNTACFIVFTASQHGQARSKCNAASAIARFINIKIANVHDAQAVLESNF